MRLKITGRVQGVYFRASTVEEARRSGVRGWVMNRPDGAVEVVAEGLSTAVDEFIAWCRQGPPGARVRELNTEWETFTGEFADFHIRR